jgi:hypothetical protein
MAAEPLGDHDAQPEDCRLRWDSSERSRFAEHAKVGNRGDIPLQSMGGGKKGS